MNITIIGSGVYGMSTAIALSQNKKNTIKMWTESEESVKRIFSSKDHYEPLGGKSLPKGITWTSSYEDALKDAELVLLMCAAKYVGSVCESIKPYITKDMHFLIGSKGIEQGSCRFVHEVFLDIIDTKKIGVISGPSFAVDIANLEPIGLSIATRPDAISDDVLEPKFYNFLDEHKDFLEKQHEIFKKKLRETKTSKKL